MSSANEQISITMTGDAASVQRMFGDLNKRMKGVGKGAERMTKTMNGGLKASATQVASLAAGYVGIGAAIGAATSAVRFFAAANKKEMAAATQAVLEYDKAFRGLAVQMGKTAEQVKEHIPQIERAAFAAGLPSVDVATRIATQAISSGVPDSQVCEGGALEAFADTFSATNQIRQGINPEALTGALVSIMDANGLARTGANVRSVGVDVQNLFRDTPLQISDLESFAKESATIRATGNIPLRDQLSIFSMIKEVSNDPSTSGVQFREMVKNISTAGGSPKKVKALARLGLTPDQVDLEGETMQDVLRLLRQSDQKVGRKTSKVSFSQIFGGATTGTVVNLLDKADEIDRRSASLGDIKKFNLSLNTARRGPTAEANRAQLNLQRARQDPRAAAIANIGVNLEAARTDQGISAVNSAIQGLVFDALVGLNFNPGFAAAIASPVDPFDPTAGPKRAAAAVAGSSATSALLDEIRALRKEALQPKEITVRTPAGARVPATAAPTDLQGLNQQR